MTGTYFGVRSPDSAPLHYCSMPDPWFDARNQQQIQSLVSLITGYRAKLVVLDNLGTISGGVDENSAEMVGVMGNLRKVAEQTGAAVAVIHHSRKGNNTGRKGDSLRGHSSIEAALDLALLVERDPKTDTINITPTKVRGALMLPFAAEFTFENDNRGQLHKARFYSITSANQTSQMDLKRTIYSHLGNQEIAKTELANQLHASIKPQVAFNKIRDAIDSMVALGHLNQSDGNNNAKLISCNPNSPP